MKRLLLVVSMLVVAPSAAFALAGDLNGPHVASRAGTDDAALHAVLGDARVKFVSGHFINSFSTLYYRGDSQSLSLFLDGLSKLDGVRVHVAFSKGTGTARALRDEKGACDFRVSHSPTGDGHSFSILVYLGGDAIDIEKVYLPEVHGRTPVKPEANATESEK